jgi:osmotically-inducible protein OsmY
MPEDTKTASAARKALAESEQTKEMDLEQVHISASAGVVFVDGEFDSQDTREAVLAVLRGAPGVRFVRDRTQINPEARGGGWREPHHHEAREG